MFSLMVRSGGIFFQTKVIQYGPLLETPSCVFLYYCAPLTSGTTLVLWFVPQWYLEKLGTRLGPQSCSSSLWMTSSRRQTQIFQQSGKMQIAAPECWSNEKSPGMPEGCICGLVTPENPVARETICAEKVVSHAAGLLVPSGTGSRSVTGECLWCKGYWPDHKTRFSREIATTSWCRKNHK